MGVEHTGETDTRAETTDGPKPPERPYSPPPDNPGAPSQPSRLQDRARVREQDDQAAPANPVLADVYTDSSGRVRIEPRYGRPQTGETASSEAETTGEPGLPTRETLDPVGARGGEPGRGEPRAPEDDPEDRDLTEPGPERRSRSRDLYRKLVTKADDTTGTADKLAEPAQKKLERVKPTGQLCGERTNSDHIKSVDQAVQAGNATVGVLGTIIVASEVTRLGVRAVRRMKGSDDAGNR